MTKLHSEPVTLKNYKEAIEIQKAIFPQEDGSQDIKASVRPDIYQKEYSENFASLQYYICRDEQDNAVGMYGIYELKQTQGDGWLGWYGVLETERGKGYGKEILHMSMDSAKEKGLENLRLYTDENDNAAACELYRKEGMLEEKYTAEKLPDNDTIFSINLHGKEVSPIGHVNLNMLAQLEGHSVEEPAKTNTTAREIDPTVAEKFAQSKRRV